MRYNNYYSDREVREMGFRSLGERVMISRDARIISPRLISVGSNVLIDAFTIMNGSITIGNHVQISANCEVYSGDRTDIIIGDFCALASFVSLYGQSDEYVLPYLNNPTVPAKYKNVHNEQIIIGNYVIIGTHSVVLPGVELGEGCTFGACSLINKSTTQGGVYVGVPCRRIHERNLEEIRQLAKMLTEEEQRRKDARRTEKILKNIIEEST